MKTAIPGLLAVVLLGTMAAASAEPLRLDAAAKVRFGGHYSSSDFFILFDDTGDGLLQLDEVTFFSGIFDSSGMGPFTRIDRIPQIANISTGDGSCVFDARSPWCFSDPQSLQVHVSSFTYAITSPDSAPALSLSRSSVGGGCNYPGSLTGKVLLRNPAPPGGRVVTLSDTLVSATMPVSVTVPAGWISANFAITTKYVTAPESGTITANIGGTLRTRNLSVHQVGVYSVVFEGNKAATVVGTKTVATSAILECEPGSALTVDLASSNAAVANPVAASVVVPQGCCEDRARFDVATSKVLSNTTVSISATATSNGIKQSKTLTVTPASFVSPAYLRFGTVPVGATSSPRAATLTNKGNMSFTIGAIGITGTNPLSFEMTETCPTILAAGASCSINVRFKPTAATSRIAKLSIPTGARSVPLIVWLSGTGT